MGHGARARRKTVPCVSIKGRVFVVRRILGVYMRGWRRSAAIAIAGASALALALTGCTPQVSVPIDVPAQAEGSLPEETVTQLQDAVTSAMTATGATGAIVGVWAPWSGSWVAGLGAQGPDGGEVTTDMAFRAADVTRAMTCDVLYQVAEDGIVGLDDSVTDWVSGLPGYEQITLRQLCDGTSGLGSYSAALQRSWFRTPDRVWNPRELMAYGVASPRANDPGAAFADSDTGYVVLGLALERATGESMSALLNEHVADPLDLEATSLPGGAASAPSPGASLRGYWSQQNGDGVWNCTDPTDFTVASASFGGADSGAVTTITDLGRYAQALAVGTLTPEGSDRFAAPVPVGAEEPTWFTAAGGAYQAGSLVGQFGAAPGYITAAFADPATGMSVAVVLNNSGATSRAGAWLAWELAAIASKAPAAEGQTAPEAGLPWTPEQQRESLNANAICAPPEG